MTFLGYECKICKETNITHSNMCKKPYLCPNCGLLSADKVFLHYS